MFFKERWINENGIEQRLIVSYSPKHKHYQREIRNRQIERASRIIDGSKRRGHNPNSPERFINEMQITIDGEIAEKSILDLDEKKIRSMHYPGR